MSIKAFLTAALVAVASVSAQNATTNGTMGGTPGNQTEYAAGLVQALQAANLTTLAGLAAQNAQALLPFLMTGNKTVFAPTNEAFAALGNASNNATLVANVLQYHIYYGDISDNAANASNASMVHTNASATANSTMTNATMTNPHTILRSLLNSTEFVQLPGNQSQVGVFTMGNGSSMGNSSMMSNSSMSGNSSMSSVTWVGATKNVTSVATTTYKNLVVHVIPEVLTIPGTLNETATAANLTQLTGALNTYAPGALQMLEAIRGVTIFAPVNAAFANVTSLLGTLNATQITDVLLNHVINGTVVYSTEITPTTNATSAAGETFTFMSGANGTYVKSGNSMSKIIRADIPIANGVVHLIDNVLANPMSNPQAAASAASVYQSMARTATAIPTGPVAAVPAATGIAAAATGGGTSGAGKVGVSAAAGALALGVGLLVGA
ncbi:hypothetical protein B0A53_03254 [Rhodotorula sp. CCFEE 5036]|nr:hypothetical protein B0A53_03254 [Rhodotorula sp. CCFEE 5036]